MIRRRATRATEADPRRAALTQALFDWYRVSGRTIPARETRDPWRLLVLEVMAQQTQLARAAGALDAFLQAFPSPDALAAASPGDVLRAWSGLGYNRRALALRAAAIAVVERHAGTIPRDVAALDALPGVGPYTARAVAAQAFGVPVGPVDVNVARVLRRIVGRPLAPSDLQRLADDLVDPDHPGHWAHATMDLATLICVPRAPYCVRCPLRTGCASADRVPPPVPRASRSRPSPPFHLTRRWLRGALVRELRAAPPGTWVGIAGPRGAHEPWRVREALQALAAEGLVELGEGDLARLPTG